MNAPKLRIRLRTKILLLALLNVALLLGAFAVFVRSQLNDDLGSFLLAALRERLVTTGRLIGADLGDATLAEWNEVLKRYSAEYGVAVLLFRAGSAQQLAGPSIALPQSVLARLQVGPNRPGGPRREGAGRGERVRAAPFMRGGFFLITDGELRYWIGTRIFIAGSAHPELMPATMLLASPSFWTNPFFFPLEQWLMMALIALAISICCWLPFVGGITRSIGAMQNVAGQIAQGKFQHQVEVARSDEIGELGSAIHRMSTQLEAHATGQKRFLASVAHELRSPIARMQVALSLVERDLEPVHHSRLNDLRDELNQMSRLTGELLTFAKADMRPEAVRLRPVPLAEIIMRAVEAESTADAPVEVRVEQSMKVQGEPEYLFRSFANLIRNAVRYASGSGPITISATRQGAEVLISVADSGPGVPVDAIPHLFSPFFRVDASRDRRSGGAGLGLAIVRSCVEACLGSVVARNRNPHGLEVIVRLPAPPTAT